MIVDAREHVGEPSLGSMSLSRAVWISVYINAARSHLPQSGDQPGDLLQLEVQI